MPRNHPRHADSHERFQTLRDSSSRLLRIRGPALSLRLAAACALSETRNRGSLGFHDANLSRRRGGSSQTASVFLNHPRAPPCFTAQPSRSPHRPWQVRSELGTASGSEGFSLFADRRAPDRLLPLGSRLRAEIVGSSPSTPWSPLRGSRYERYREPRASWRKGRARAPSPLGNLCTASVALARSRREADRIVRVGSLPTTRTHRDATSREGAIAPQQARGAARRSPLWRGVLPVVSAFRLRRGSESPLLPRPLGAATRLAREVRGSTCFGYRLGGSQRFDAAGRDVSRAAR